MRRPAGNVIELDLIVAFAVGDVGDRLAIRGPRGRVVPLLPVRNLLRGAAAGGDQEDGAPACVSRKVGSRGVVGNPLAVRRQLWRADAMDRSQVVELQYVGLAERGSGREQREECESFHA